MNIRKTGKRILSLLLTLALCVSIWVGDLQTVMAVEDEITDQTLTMQTQEIINEGSGTEEGEGDRTEESEGDRTEESEGDRTEESEGDGTEESEGDGTEESEGDGTEESEGDRTEESEEDETEEEGVETTLTDEDVEMISEAICDALYDEIEERFYEEWKELCNSIASEYGLEDEDNEEITDELYVQFYTALYESSCTLLGGVLTEELDTAGEQEAYADLQNEAVYNKVYNSIYDKLYEAYVKGLKEMGITTLEGVASDPDLNSPTEVTLADEVGVTGITVTGKGVKVSEDTSSLPSKFTIDLSEVAVLVSTDISVEMNFELLQGVGDLYDGGTDIANRKIREGDRYTVTVPEGLIITDLDGDSGNGIDLTTSGGITVAKATLDSTTSVTITFTDNINADKGHWDVKYGLKMTLQLDKDKLGTETTVDWEAINALGGADYFFTLPAAPASVPDSVTKSGRYDADANEIIWTIEIEGITGVDIGGWTIVDALDTSYQTYKSASFTSDGTTQPVTCTESSSATSSSDGSMNTTEYTYKIPEDSTIPAILKIVTTPTSETLAKLVDSGTTSDIEINNTVYLKNASDEDTGLEGNGEATLPRTTPISKSGEVVSADLMEWTLTANPDEAYIYGATVTDKLQSCLHLTGDGNGETKYIYIGGTKVILMKDGSANKWTGSITDGSGSIIECTYEESAGSNDNNILMINFADGKGTLEGKSCEITFETSIELDNGTDSRYEEESMTVQNIAEIECRFPDYNGDLGKNTSKNYGGYGTGKINWDVSQNMIEKSSSVDTKDGNITWTIKPSIGTGTFKEAVITDEINQGGNGNSKQTFVKDSIKINLDNDDITTDAQYTDCFKIEYGYDSSDTNKTNPIKLIITLYGKSDSPTKFSSDDLNKIKIIYQTHMDGFGTTVEDGTAIKQTYYNKAGLKVDTCEEVEDEESLTVQDNMLSKGSTSYYEESALGSAKRGYKYTITINEMGMKISNSDNVIPVVLTDDLKNLQLTYNNGTAKPDTEAKLELYKVVISKNDSEIYSKEVENSCRYYTYRVDSGETLGELKTTADFSKLAEDGSKVTVDLYVVITNADKFFKQGIKLQASNKASVEVTTDTGKGIFEAEAEGTTQVSTISNDLIMKTASSKKAQSGEDGLYSDWKILINPWSADMDDITITDKIPQAQASYVSFDYDSVKLYEAKHSATGDVSISDTEAALNYTVEIVEDENGDIVLTVTIPKCTKTYYLKYRTYYLSQKLGTSYKNSARLAGRGISDDASYEIEIDSSAWAEATKRASITVNKVDKDAVGTSAAICGATFALYNENGVKILERSTDENGQIVFSGLALDKKYTVEETGTASGYEWSTEVADENRATVETSAGNTAIERTFFNTRTTGTVSFTKVDDSDLMKGLGGAGFLLYYTEGGVTKLVKTLSTGSDTDGSYEFVEFVNAASGDDALTTDAGNAGTVLKSAESGTVGNVEVTGLPWGEGTYYFVEIEGPNGYNADSSKHYEFTLRLSSTDEEQSSPDLVYGMNFAMTDARYIILNSKYKFKLIKQDENENPIAGVEFGLYSDESCTHLVSFAKNWGCTNSFRTDETGTVIIDDRAIELSSAGNPICYYLKEISAPSDYKVSSEAVKFYIDSTTKKVVVVNKNEIKDYDITKAEKENTFTLKDSVIQGSIALYKTDNDGNGIKGVKFDLYKLADAAVMKKSGNTAGLSGELGTLISDSKAKLIVNNLTTDAGGYWYSNTCTKTYTDFTGSKRKVSDGLTGGWYCFMETEVVGNVIKSDKPYLFCIGEDADGKVTITNAEGNSLLNDAININADGRYDITNTRITAYLRKEGVNKEDNSIKLLTDSKNQLTLTLYEKQNSKWIKVRDFKPGKVVVTDNSLGSYEYSNDISQYLKTGKEYKIVETQPHSSLTYMKADDYYFKVDASGDLYPMILQEGGSFKVESKLDPAVIVMQDVEATMSIQNHYTHEGIFVCNLTDNRGRKIVADQTLTDVNEGSALDITVDGIDGTPGSSTVSLYMLQRGVKYTLTSTYYLTKEDCQNNRNGYTTTTVVTCNEYGQLVLADGRELAGNTFHIYGATQIVVRKVAADGVLEGYEIPGARLVLLQGSKQAPQVEYDGDPVDWSWTTDGYKPVGNDSDAGDTTGNGGTGGTNSSGLSFEGTDGKSYVYEDPDGNLNKRAGYVAGFSGATVFTLRETKAPLGYKRAADIKFSFDDSGNIEILSGAEVDQITIDAGIVAITMKDERGSDKTSGQSGPYKSNGDVEAVIGTGYSADSSSSDTDTASSAVQLTVAEADVKEQDKKEGRNVKTEDKTPIALYMVLSVVILGAFAVLTWLLKKKKSK